MSKTNETKTIQKIKNPNTAYNTNAIFTPAETKIDLISIDHTFKINKHNHKGSKICLIYSKKIPKAMLFDNSYFNKKTRRHN